MTPPGNGYTPIADYGLIGDRHSAALVSKSGSIDWCPMPRFDSPSIFGAILDSEKGGRFAITPTGSFTSTQRYLPDTNVLETTFQTDTGVATLIDFMPAFRDPSGVLTVQHSIIRVIRGTGGTVLFALTFSPRPEYGALEPEVVPSELPGAYEAVWGNGEALSLRIVADVEVELTSGKSEFAVREGQELSFVATYRNSEAGHDDQAEPDRLLARTSDYWRAVATRVEYEGTHKAEVTRSYLALHLLTFEPSGGIVAAPTSSLPEWIGGTRNWDYRFTWLRDAAFTIEALLKLGHEDEAVTFFDWLGKVCGLDENHIHVLYRVDAEPDVDERTLTHLSGYRGSGPVRVGNEAFH